MILSKLLCNRSPLEYNPNVGISLFKGSRLIHPLNASAQNEIRLLRSTPPANRSLHPQILSTCKQLYQDGLDILYSNTVNCRIGSPYLNPEHRRPRVIILHPQYDGEISKLPAAIVQKMSKVHIQMFAHHQYGKRDQSLGLMKQGLGMLAFELRKAPQWQDITLEVIHVYKKGNSGEQGRSPADCARVERVLYPVQYVRHRTSVAITGLNDDFASKLSATMTSTNPFADLPLAADALDKYMTSVLQPLIMGGGIAQFRNVTTAISHARSVCEWAIRHEEPDRFISGRKRIMALVNGLVLQQEAKVFKHDPQDWLSNPSLSQSAEEVQQNSLDVDDLLMPLPEDNASTDDEDEDWDTDAYDDTDMSTDSDDSDEDEEDEDLDSLLGDDEGLCDCEHCMSHP